MKNFDEIREREEQLGSEWVYGAVATDLAAVPLALRQQYLPTGVLQFNNIFDTNGCASRGPLNIFETKLDYFWDNGMHPAIKQWFTDNGYRVNGKFALCDAFIEILSGTKSNGNSLKAPVETIRKYGVIPAYLIPLEDGMTFDTYMNPARVTAAHKKLGEEFMRRIVINYEQVPLARFDDAINDDLLDVALHGFGPLVDGVYQPTDEQINHVVARFTNEIDIFDNYVSFIKRLAKTYKFFDWGYSLSITAQNPFPEETLTVWQTLLKFNLQSFFPSFLAFFTKITTPPMTTVVTIDQPFVQPPANNLLNTFCLAIQRHEGWNWGSRSYRNHNPGNCRYSSVGYDASYGHVGKDADNFAIFSDYETGFRYLKNLVKGKISANPSQTFYQFFSVYAPSFENDTKHYAEVVAEACNLTPTTSLSALL